MIRFERIVRFSKAKTDYSLETDYSLVRIETDLFLQQAPVLIQDFTEPLTRKTNERKKWMTDKHYAMACRGDGRLGSHPRSSVAQP